MTATTLFKHRIWVVLFWIILALSLLPLAGTLDENLQTAADIRGGTTAEAAEILNNQFALPFSDTVTLVVSGIPSPQTQFGVELLSVIVERLEGSDAVAGVVSYQLIADPVFLSENGEGTFLIVGLNTTRARPDKLVAELQALTNAIQSDLHETNPDIIFRWTGDAALSVDLRQWGTENAEKAEIQALPIIAILLLLTFGALVASSLPIFCGLLTITVATGLVALLAGHFPVSIIVINIVTMVGLGVSIDYALISVSRFREELESGRCVAEAASLTAIHAGRTISISAIAVAIGFGAILATPIRELQSIAIGGIIVVIIAGLISATLLPVLLFWIGRNIDFGRVRFPALSNRMERFWHHWADLIIRRPRVVMISSIGLLALMAAPTWWINIALPEVDWLPIDAPSVQAIEDLDAMGRQGAVQAIQVIVELPDGMRADTAEGWTAIMRLTEQLQADPQVAFARSISFGSNGANPLPSTLPLIPHLFTDIYISTDRRFARIDVLPDDALMPHEVTLLARDLGNRNLADMIGTDARVLIGGLPAYNAEYEDVVRTRFLMIVGLVILGTFLVLALRFRSILIPLKAVVLNVLSVAAGFGVVVLVFQEGWGSSLIGLNCATGSILPILPIMVFGIMFGLSMDYEIFLVSRFVECRKDGYSDDDALRLTLTKTGNVITSAAAIMISVFAAFIFGDFLLIKMLGFALAVTVLIDATIVRLGIGPAMLKLGGKWNWWPGERSRAITD